MEEQELQILEGALGLYFKFGIKSVTMDDVASNLGISKKTIYRFFTNKAELVHKSSAHVISRIQEGMMQVSHHSQNAIDELFEMDNVVSNALKVHHPAINYQLKKYYSKTFEMVNKARREMVMTFTHRNLEKGIAEGFYREDLQIEIIKQLYYSRVLLMADDDSFPLEGCPIEIFSHENLIYHIRGIASPQGITYLEQKLKKS